MAKGEFGHTSVRYANTRTRHATSRQMQYFSNIIFRPHYCVFRQRAVLSLVSTTSRFTPVFTRTPAPTLTIRHVLDRSSLRTCAPVD